MEPPQLEGGLSPARGRIILPDLLFAAAVHIVVLASIGEVLAFAAIELVGLLIPQPAKGIVAIPTVDDVRAIASFIKHVIAASPVNDIIALAKFAMQQAVVAWPSVDDVVA